MTEQEAGLIAMVTPPSAKNSLEKGTAEDSVGVGGEGRHQKVGDLLAVKLRAASFLSRSNLLGNLRSSGDILEQIFVYKHWTKSV